MKVGERIRVLRISRGLTQEELGEILGVTKGAVQKYENGQIKNFKSDTIKKLCEYFGVPPVSFVYDSNEIPEYTRPTIESFLYTYFEGHSGEILKSVNVLNEDGVRKIEEYAKDLMEIERYRKYKRETSD